MSLKFLSAGLNFPFSRQILFALLAACILLPGCRDEKSEKDPEITELQKDVKQLTEENRELLKEIQGLDIIAT